ncbi:MAG TPA: discoidin domain-containing protein, partial [Polyangia bacterium]|nr:discoidin domain-containing protein [Polyangia bacterium]
MTWRASQKSRRLFLVRWRQWVAVAVVIGTVGAAGLAAQAATVVWGGGTGTFGTAANWVGGSAPGSSDTASFDGWIPLPKTVLTESASVSNGSDPPSSAGDGRQSTRWSTGAVQNGSEWFKIDLGTSMTFSRVDLDTGNSWTTDYPRGYSLAVSTDNSSYTTVTSGSGSGQMTSITFTAQTARYIKISQTGSSGSNWWGIAEYNVYGPSSWVPLSTSGWTPTASRSSGTETLAKSLDGDRSTRWSTGAPVVTTDWYKVDMGSAQTFSRVEWDGNSATWSCDYPPSWTLAVSNNDSTYTTVTTGTSSVNLTNSVFAAQTARYIKISANATACGGGSWWGIA